jgi:hypothetical protein
MKLHAMATNSGDTFSMCTGAIADGMEGVFFLDYLTGDLQCMVPNARTGRVGGAYKYNVMADLNVEAGAEKKPQFLMVVADATTGNWVAYSLPWSRQLAATGAPQGGTLLKIGAGKARELALRNE